MKKQNFVQELAAILTRNGAIKDKDAASLYEEFKQRSSIAFEYFLLDEGLVEKGPLLKALSEYYNTEAVDVTGLFFQETLVRLFPKEIMLENVFIPWEEDADVLVVIVSNPENEDLLPIINTYVSYDVKLVAGLQREIEDAVKEFYDPAPTEIPLDEDIHEQERIEDEEHRIIEQEQEVEDPDDMVNDEDKYFT